MVRGTGRFSRAFPGILSRAATFSACIVTILLARAAAAAGHEDYLREGNRLFAEGDYIRAEEKYILARNEKPDAAAAVFNIGNTYFQRQDYRQAIDRYREAVGLARGDRALETIARYNLATARARESERTIGDVTDPEKLQTGLDLLREAISGYREVLESDPGHADARHNLAVAQLRIKNLLDTLKRLREEAEKNRPEGQDPIALLRELIAEEEAEIALTRKAIEAESERGILEEQRRTVDRLAGAAGALADAPADAPGGAPAVSERRDGLLRDLRALESDPGYALGAAEIAAARKEVEGGGAGAGELAEAVEKLAEAAGEAGKLHRETLEKDRADQEATRQKTLGLAQGLRRLAAGEPPPDPQAGAAQPGGTAGQPGGQRGPAAQPPPPEVAERLEKVAGLCDRAAGHMEKALGSLGTGAEAAAAPAEALPEQEAALAALKKALEEAEKLPRPEQPQPQGGEQNQEDGEKKEDQEKKDREKGQDEKKKDGGKDQEGGEDEKQAAEEKKLSQEEAERLLQRFLDRDAERERDRRQRALRGGGPGRVLGKDW